MSIKSHYKLALIIFAFFLLLACKLTSPESKHLFTCPYAFLEKNGATYSLVYRNNVKTVNELITDSIQEVFFKQCIVVIRADSMFYYVRFLDKGFEKSQFASYDLLNSYFKTTDTVSLLRLDDVEGLFEMLP